MSTIQLLVARAKAMEPEQTPLASRLASRFLQSQGVFHSYGAEELTDACRILGALNPGLAQRFREEFRRLRANLRELRQLGVLMRN
jgi:hypothetical protein